MILSFSPRLPIPTPSTRWRQHSPRATALTLGSPVFLGSSLTVLLALGK